MLLIVKQHLELDGMYIGPLNTNMVRLSGT